MTLLPKRKRFEDPKYLKSYNGASCFICGINDGTVVGAHPRDINKIGKGQKDHDWLTLPLCYQHHQEQHLHKKGETACWKEWGYTKKQRVEIARQRYDTWRTG